jgi:hypothetical protein
MNVSHISPTCRPTACAPPPSTPNTLSPCTHHPLCQEDQDTGVAALAARVRALEASNATLTTMLHQLSPPADAELRSALGEGVHVVVGPTNTLCIEGFVNGAAMVPAAHAWARLMRVAEALSAVGVLPVGEMRVGAGTGVLSPEFTGARFMHVLARNFYYTVGMQQGRGVYRFGGSNPAPPAQPPVVYTPPATYRTLDEPPRMDRRRSVLGVPGVLGHVAGTPPRPVLAMRRL